MGTIREHGDEAGPATTDPARKPAPAQPKYAIGETVRYRDHDGRDQMGIVLRIMAVWHPWSPERASITLTVEHSTYPGRRTFISQEDASPVAAELEGETDG